MDKKPLYAHVLIDRSGSMASIRDATVEAINEYIGGLAANPELDAAVSVSFFNSGHRNEVEIETVHDGVKASLIPKMANEAFVPNGGTPLNDAIGKIAALMEKQWHRPAEAIALVIMTDGHENSSREYTRDAVKALLARLQSEKNWLVIYLGANQDAFAEGSARGTVAGSTMSFAATPKGAGATLRAAARATASYASTGDVGMAAFTYQERAEAEGRVEGKK